MTDLTKSEIESYLLPLFEAIDACIPNGHTFEQRIVFKKAELSFLVSPTETLDRYHIRITQFGFPEGQFDILRAIEGITLGPGIFLTGDFPLDVNHFLSDTSPMFVGWIAARNAPEKLKKGLKGITYLVDGLVVSDPAAAVEAVKQSASQLTEPDTADSIFLAVHLGGSGYSFGENDVLAFGSDADGIRLKVVTADRLVHLPYSEVIDVTVDGGVYQKGGGFSGGGFGVVGFAVGAAASMALNKVTTRTEIQTLVRITTNRGEINLYTNQITPSDLELSLSEVRTGIRQSMSHRDLQTATSPTNSLADELLKISELHKSGILSDEEFQAAKQRLIG